jgi:hypothetical protein
MAVGRKSPVSLYREDIASMEEAGGYDQADAGGFIKLTVCAMASRFSDAGPAAGRPQEQDRARQNEEKIVGESSDGKTAALRPFFFMRTGRSRAIEKKDDKYDSDGDNPANLRKIAKVMLA